MNCDARTEPNPEYTGISRLPARIVESAKKKRDRSYAEGICVCRACGSMRAVGRLCLPES